VIEGTRVNLRRVEEADCDRIADWEAADASHRFLRPAHEPRRRVRGRVADRLRDEDAVFFVVETRDGEAIGTVGLLLSREDRSAEIVVNIAGEKQRLGYGVHALAMCIAFGFKELNLNCIHSRVFATNAHMLALLRRIGADVEATCQARGYAAGRYFDVVWTSFLQDSSNLSARRYTESYLGIDLVEFE